MRRVQQMLPACAAAIALCAGSAAAQFGVRPTNDAPNPFRAVENYFKLPEGRSWGSTSALAVDRDGQSLWVFERCGGSSCATSDLAPIVEFDLSGKVLRSFGAGLFVFPHGIHVDRDGNVWVSDAQGNQQRRAGAAPDTPLPQPPKGHQVVKFSPDGKILLTLGRAGVAGEGPDTFNRPSDVLIAPNGDIFVSDGHGGDSNARIVKFSKDGTFIKAWGKAGSAPGEFDAPHGLAMDSRGRLFVADRGNSRIQIFDQDGTFIDEWRQFGRPSGIYIDAHDNLYAADTESDDTVNAGWRRGIRIGSVRDGRVTAFIQDADPDGTGEGVVADASGGVYGSLTRGRAVKKYLKQ